MMIRSRRRRPSKRLADAATLALFAAVVLAGAWLAVSGRIAGVPAPPWWTPTPTIAASLPNTARPGSPRPGTPVPSMTASSMSASRVPTPSPTAPGVPASGRPSATAQPQAPDGDPATVVRVVDGDTIDVERAGERVRVRLLNIDTPETKAPGQPVECLGPQASAFTARALPAGTRVTLRYDRTRYDKYGRTLAGVFVGERLVNREIASAGLATPVTFGSNRRFRAEVDAGYAQARQAHRGFFDPAAQCPVPTPR